MACGVPECSDVGKVPAGFCTSSHEPGLVCTSHHEDAPLATSPEMVEWKPDLYHDSYGCAMPTRGYRLSAEVCTLEMNADCPDSCVVDAAAAAAAELEKRPPYSAEKADDVGEVEARQKALLPAPLVVGSPPVDARLVATAKPGRLEPKLQLDDDRFHG